MKKIIFSLIFFSALTIHLNGAIPPGYYYLARGKQHTELKTALKDIVSSGTFLSYGSGADFTWQGFYFTDRNAADSTVIDMYSNIVRKQPDFNSVYGMHIEHSFPKSWWGGYVNNAYKDLNHLYPSDGLTNSTKNDFPLGEVEIPASLLDNGVSKVGKNTFGTTYSGNCFEPADEYKGDFARSYLYVSTVYDKHSETWQTPMTETSSYLIWKPWAIEMLLKWHHEDPVSEKELTRVEEVYKIQGNRNPFIDYPDLVDYIWGDKTTETYSFPTETEPFLVTPNRWTKIDFGVVMQNDTQRSIIDLEGVNLTSNLSYSLKNTTSGLTISYGTPTTTGDVYSRAIFIDFDASTVGETIDTLLISGGGLNANILIPIKARVTSNFMALDATSITAVSATLNWMKLPDATSYQLDVYQGAEHAGDLFFSSYVEGSTGFNKAVAIYNGTGATVDLSKYSLKKQNNGYGSFGLETPLVGTLANGAVYVVAHIGAGTAIANQANLKLGSGSNDPATVVSFSGNDAIALYHSGLQIDVIGEIDNPSDWGKDVTLQRKTTITGPITQFSWDEWTNRGADIYTNLNSHTTTFSSVNYLKKDVDVGTATSFELNGLNPESEYTYSIKAMGTTTTSANSIRFKTKELEAPLALDAVIIFSDSFEALWEDVPDARHYLLDVYQLAGSGIVTYEEGFSNIDSCKTAGWNFGSTGTYTSAAYLGKSAPAISFTNAAETLTTPTHSSPITNLSFMYRYGSGTEAAQGSILAVDGHNGTAWVTIDSLKNTGSTAKNYPSYAFSMEQNFTAIRFVYALKKSGNLSVDDVSITYGHEDTTFLCKDRIADFSTRKVSGTEANTDYYYRLRSVAGFNPMNGGISPYSNEIKVTTTDIPNAISTTNSSKIQIFTTPQGVDISGLTENSHVVLYNISGICVYQARNVASKHFIPITQKGIFIIQANVGNEMQVFKIMK